MFRHKRYRNFNRRKQKQRNGSKRERTGAANDAKNENEKR